MREKRSLPPYSVVHALLRYDPSTGELLWRYRKNGYRGWNARYAGKRAGTVSREGYLIVAIEGVAYKAHRLAWVLHHGRAPSDFIDHINGDRLDNRITNLRDVPEQGNARNRSLRSDNSTGAPGVYPLPKRDGWYAQGRAKGKNVHLGTFDSFADAAAARQKYQAMNGYHPNHGRTA